MAYGTMPDAFAAFLEQEGCLFYAAEPDGLNYWAVKQLLFHWTLVTGAIGDEEGYNDRYCYQTDVLAINALRELSERNWIGEPEGWHRHPKTGRRRPDGDASREYVSH